MGRDPTDDRHDITADGVDADGQLIATETIVETHGRSVVAEHRSTRLPLGALTLFEDDAVDVSDLDAGTRAWLRAESGARANELRFEEAGE